MSKMSDLEINEVSDAFLEAWSDYFGDAMYYVPFDTNTAYDGIYLEAKVKLYRYDLKKLFHGTLKEAQISDELHQSGGKVKRKYTITFVTNELAGQGVQYINNNDIIEYTDKYGNTFKYSIYDDYKKVQLVNTKIFTKLEVIPYE
jgi:hypothetical protein